MNNKNKNNFNKKSNNRILNRNSSEDDEYDMFSEIEEDYTVDSTNLDDEDYEEEVEDQEEEIEDEEQPEEEDDDEIEEYYGKGLLPYHNEKLNADVEVEHSSPAESDYNADNDAFHLDILRNSIDGIPAIPKKYKNGTRKSLTFTNPQMREIERQNRILLQKILSKGPSYSNSSSKHNLKLNAPTTRLTSAAINRKKQQRQIDMYNQILKRKIDEIGSRRKQFY